MRNVMKAATLESKFPLLAVENGCIVSKEADVTVAFRVELPELFSVTGSEYEAVHSAWHKAVKVLPEYSIVHKQDFFIEEKYRPETDRDDLSFLSRSFERHFNERPFLNHFCYLFLTKTTKARSRQESTFSTLCKGRLVPKEIEDRETVTRFIEAVGQFEKIMNDSGLVTLRRLTTDEITGTERSAGIVEKYLSLSQHDTTVLKDIQLNPEEMRIGDDILCLHTLSDTEDLPGKVATDSRYERLSTDRSDCRLSFAAPVGLLLDCNHCYNQYIFIDDHGENLKRFEQTARNMHSLSRYSRSNQINKAWIEEYLNEAHSKGLTSVRCHCNVMAWSDDREELRRIKNEVGSQLALMECKPRHNTVDVPTLFWAAIPGNEGDFPFEESFYTFIPQALCFFTEETNYKDSLSPFGIKMADRMTGRPLHLDISDLPMKKGVISNRNKFVLGPSGSGKSFFMNHLVRQYYEQNSHIVLIDTGNSYQGRGRDLLHVHGGEAHQLQPLLHGRLQVQRGEEGQHQDVAAGAVEGRGRENHEDGERRAGQCGVGVHPPDTTEPGHRPLVRHLLRVHAERLPEGAGGKGHQGEPGGFQHRQLPDHAAAVLQGRALRLPAELEREHRPAAQAVHRLRDRRREGQRRAVPRGYDHHHGSLHQQAAPPERGAEDADLRGGLESPFLAEHVRIFEVHVQDRQEIFRRGDCRHAGSR